MRIDALLLAVFLLKNSYATPIVTGHAQSELQAPLEDLDSTVAHTHQRPASSRQLHGRFLHITDLHPDPFYKIHSSTDEDDACHRGKGAAGIYGAETTDCDSPFTLIDATFKWIEENLKDTIDFVIWTGDSARHDSDEKIPRNQDEVLSTNTKIVEKIVEVFGDGDDSSNPLAIPVIPTFGNNDILPHNIFLSGPNKWLKAYHDIWSNFIPEEQRHGFQRGGWFWVEVIPQKLAVFSLNTLYFFDHNAAVDGCALRSEPGYEHMEWLRIQLQFMRLRGLKAILTGHVPPARTGSKQLWDETCWQKYTLWLRQYRDVVVGGLYGHMNIDHFMLQDAKEVDLLFIDGQSSEDQSIRALMDEELSIESASDYLEELRENWSSLPNPSSAIKEYDEAESEIGDIPEEATKKKNKKGKKAKKDKRFKKIGGPWGERYQVTNVGPSVVPNYFPTLRVIEYNITGLDKTSVWANPAVSAQNQELDWLDDDTDSSIMYMNEFLNEQLDFSDDESIARKKKKHKKPKNPDLIVPPPPSKSSPPGPAYSPQTLTLLGYTQYFTNLTHINNDDIVKPDEIDVFEDEIDADKWREGKHKGKHPKNKLPHPKPFKYEVEYDTFTDSIYKLKDMTVRSWLNLAHRIGQYRPAKGDELGETILDGIKEGDDDFDEDDYDDDDDDEFEVESGKKHRKRKHHRQHEKNKIWLRFIRRAFIGTLEDEDLQTFDQIPGPDVLAEETGSIDVHDGEL